ncbi:type IV pilus modification PilV family protein [Chitinolyticbacter meiyuanensis]|uniref:type IV pilus modification PilV family protein n=1 Tax=Chitinolyticbacter meiyuanensis TaxID=682798 RepID=UPI0011E599D4|nr:prepilin-type N-terminal cleavage/methylation domain-containing protein [Chitinolyticbacter meiyuanensis]
MRRELGFSLIEVLIATVIICIAAIALARYQGTMTRSTVMAAERNEAAQYALAEMETVRALALAGTTLTAQTHSPITGKTGVFTVARSAPEAIVVAPTPFSSVRVTVSWDDTEGSTQHVVLQSSMRNAVNSVVGPGITPTP